MYQTYEDKNFNTKGKEDTKKEGYTHISVHFLFDAKQDVRNKSRLVLGGHMTGPNIVTCYSKKLSLCSMRMFIFLAEVNDFKLFTG